MSPQRAQTLKIRNEIAARLPRPSEEHLTLIHDSIRPEYLKAFTPSTDLGPRFWMRFRTNADINAWARILQEFMGELVDRAETLDPHALVLGKSLSW